MKNPFCVPEGVKLLWTIPPWRESSNVDIIKITLSVMRNSRDRTIKVTAGSRICVEHPGNESLDRYVGIGRWKLSTAIVGSNRHGRSTNNSTCHGKWIGDSRLLVDCHDPRCAQSSRVPPHTTQLFGGRGRSRRGALVGNADDGASRSWDRVVRRRRRGRRRKRSRRRRRASIAER